MEYWELYQPNRMLGFDTTINIFLGVIFEHTTWYFGGFDIWRNLSIYCICEFNHLWEVIVGILTISTKCFNLPSISNILPEVIKVRVCEQVIITMLKKNKNNSHVNHHHVTISNIYHGNHITMVNQFELLHFCHGWLVESCELPTVFWWFLRPIEVSGSLSIARWKIRAV